MNPLPQLPMLPAPGWIDLFALVGVAAVAALVGGAVILGLTLWGVRNPDQEHARIVCPMVLRPVRVHFRLSPSRRRIDVLGCSRFGRRPITCGKVCLKPSTAG